MNPGHINNLYNTCFWAHVLHGGKTETQAGESLKVSRKDLQAFVVGGGGWGLVGRKDLQAFVVGGGGWGWVGNTRKGLRLVFLKEWCWF